MSKAFDLKKVLAGEAVVTMNGTPVKVIGWFPEIDSEDKLVGIATGDLLSWNADGIFDPHQFPCSLDLQMEAK